MDLIYYHSQVPLFCNLTVYVLTFLVCHQQTNEVFMFVIGYLLRYKSEICSCYGILCFLWFVSLPQFSLIDQT
jgi:hypothetical protein